MKKKILVVDDEQEIVGLLVDFLTSAGYETQSAYNGEEAVEKFKQFSPDLVLMDLKMPKKNGYEASKEIRKISDCAIIIVTGFLGQMGGVEDAVGSGVNDFFTKPVDLKRLLARVKLLLENQ